MYQSSGNCVYTCGLNQPLFSKAAYCLRFYFADGEKESFCSLLIAGRGQIRPTTQHKYKSLFISMESSDLNVFFLGSGGNKSERRVSLSLFNISILMIQDVLSIISTRLVTASFTVKQS